MTNIIKLIVTVIVFLLSFVPDGIQALLPRVGTEAEQAAETVEPLAGEADIFPLETEKPSTVSTPRPAATSAPKPATATPAAATPTPKPATPTPKPATAVPTEAATAAPTEVATAAPTEAATAAPTEAATAAPTEAPEQEIRSTEGDENETSMMTDF